MNVDTTVGAKRARDPGIVGVDDAVS